MDYKKTFTAKYNRESWYQLLHDIFGEKATFQTYPQEVSVNEQIATQALYLGKISLADNRMLAVYEAQLAPNVNIARNRRGIRDMLTADWKNLGCVGAFVLSFRNDEACYRFSYVSETWDFNANKEYERISTDTRRFTYLLGEKQQCRTAAMRFQKLRGSSKTLQDITEAFNVEALSADFYKRLFQWYEWALSENTGITFPNKPDTVADDRENLDIKLIRLVTRLLFVWFIKQKGLIPEEIFAPQHLQSILKNFKETSMTDGSYYNAILQNLFFATLNCAITERSIASAQSKRDTRNLYRYDEMFNISKEKVVEMFAKVPFLNGGLFECLDKLKGLDDTECDILYDGFSRNATKASNGNYKYRAFVPNALFFSKDENQPGLITLLGEYNFTIEENSPDDANVSLDPELLGQVFENLLAAYNPETQDSARKATGSFYTPRVIVNYMVNETLIAYIKSKKIDGVTDTSLRNLFCYHSKNEDWTKERIKEVTDALKTVKIIDPACGSGAFPMGCLTQIIDVIETLNDNECDRYSLKLEVIENCLYGVDIQSIAMMICKLRFFISLICDQENIDLEIPEDNFGVNPLPNLETKFVAANSLLKPIIREFESYLIRDEKIDKLKNELLCIRRNHFLARGRKAKREERRKDEEKRIEIQNYMLKLQSKPDEERISAHRKELSRLNEELATYSGEQFVNSTHFARPRHRAVASNWADLWIINTHNGVRGEIVRIDITEYPAVKRWLDEGGIAFNGKVYKGYKQIKERADQGDTPYNLRNCAYLEDFSYPKLVYMEIQTDNPKEGYPFPCFSYDEKKYVVANTAYIMSSYTVDIRYILAILNSSLGGFLAKLYVTQLQQRQFRMLAQYVTNFPIPKCSNKEMDSLIGLVKSHLECPSDDIEETINEKAFELYGLNNEEKEFIRNKED